MDAKRKEKQEEIEESLLGKIRTDIKNGYISAVVSDIEDMSRLYEETEKLMPDAVLGLVTQARLYSLERGEKVPPNLEGFVPELSSYFTSKAKQLSQDGSYTDALLTIRDLEDFARINLHPALQEVRELKREVAQAFVDVLSNEARTYFELGILSVAKQKLESAVIIAKPYGVNVSYQLPEM